MAFTSAARLRDFLVKRTGKSLRISARTGCQQGYDQVIIILNHHFFDPNFRIRFTGKGWKEILFLLLGFCTVELALSLQALNFRLAAATRIDPEPVGSGSG